MLLLLVMAVDHPRDVSTYYANQSQPAAHGRNVVNVILVAFRAFDTLGEITVLGTAAFGAYVLLQREGTEEEKQH